MQFFAGDFKTHGLGIAVHHFEISLLIHIVESQPQAETVGQRDLFLDRFRRIDGGALFVLDHVAAHQMAAVGCGVEQHIGRAALDAAFQHGFQRFIGVVVGLEGQIVAKQDDALTVILQRRQQPGQGDDVLAVNFHQDQIVGKLFRHFRMNRLDQRTFAGAARPPQQRIVGGQALGKAGGIVQQLVDLAVDALQQRQVDPVDGLDRGQTIGVGMPDKGLSLGQIHRRAGGRGQTVQSIGNA